MTADIDIIFKIAGIGIAIAVLNQVLVKAGREEQAMLVTLAGGRRFLIGAAVNGSYNIDACAYCGFYRRCIFRPAYFVCNYDIRPH